ncbi:MAG TPA: hypothetical protein VMY88_09820 [Acidimicrobiales bacterium]|nr:hypothetical protein [Acidimicrobiales bacterium]
MIRRLRALGLCVAAALLTAVPTAGPATGRPPELTDGCTAWGLDSSGLGPTTCRWEAREPGGFWATGIVHFRIHRAGKVFQHSWYVSCAAPPQRPLGSQTYFEPGDVVEVTVEVGWATVGSHAGYPCW